MHLPDYSYKNAGINQFYYINKTIGNSEIIPLIMPFKVLKMGSPKEWMLDTDLGGITNELGGNISPLTYFNAIDDFVYGYKSIWIYNEDPNFSIPEKWFIINTQEKKLTFFDKEADFKSELKKLNLPEKFLNPDEVYEQYKNDRVLPWFPEDIKKQLEEVKVKRGK